VNEPETTSIFLADDRISFLPGEKVAGVARWAVNRLPSSIEIRLFWFTSGSGDRDVGIVQSVPVEPALVGEKAFEFQLPLSPYSLKGNLISLTWAVEIVIEPKARSARAELVMAPNRVEVILPPPTG
jgi:hypothetical protein